MVSYRDDDRVVHSRFRDLGDFLEAGDVLVINTSATMNAAVGAGARGRMQPELHSRHIYREGSGSWSFVGPWSRSVTPPPARRCFYRKGLPSRYTPHIRADRPGRRVTVVALYPRPAATARRVPRPARVPDPLRLRRESWPISYYQTVYATERAARRCLPPGGGSRQSSSRVSSPRACSSRPDPAHGVASLEDDEPPMRSSPRPARECPPGERSVPRAAGSSRSERPPCERSRPSPTRAAPPTPARLDELHHARTPRPVGDLMLTGLHEPRSSHLAMLEALADREHLRVTYGEALREGYLWHEFGDLHLIL